MTLEMNVCVQDLETGRGVSNWWGGTGGGCQMLEPCRESCEVAPVGCKMWKRSGCVEDPVGPSEMRSRQKRSISAYGCCILLH